MNLSIDAGLTVEEILKVESLYSFMNELEKRPNLEELQILIDKFDPSLEIIVPDKIHQYIVLNQKVVDDVDVGSAFFIEFERINTSQNPIMNSDGLRWGKAYVNMLYNNNEYDIIFYKLAKFMYIEYGKYMRAFNQLFRNNFNILKKIIK